MTQMKPRRGFRFHLLTLVLMAFAAGLLIWPNFVPNPPFQYHYYQYKSMFAHYYGWPVAFAWHDYSVSFAMSIEGQCRTMKGPALPMKLSWIPGLLIDGVVFAGVLALVAFVSESILRRSAARARGTAT